MDPQIRSYSGPTAPAAVQAFETDASAAAAKGWVPTDHYVDDSTGYPQLVVKYERTRDVKRERLVKPALATMALGLVIAMGAGIASLATYVEAASQGGGTVLVLYGAVAAGLLVALRGLVTLIRAYV